MSISSLKTNLKSSKKAISFIVLLVILPIIALRLLGLLQSVELAAYDLLFYLSPQESQEERIILVVWGEEELQSLEETTINDRTLSSVLTKISEQQPRVIGLDLYRDVPVTSRLLSDEQNDLAYERLTDIFRNTPNLIGIEKVWEPIVNPSKVLLEEGRVASSDIIVDLDNTIRRSFIDPLPLKDKNDPSSVRQVPYIGVELAYFYLAEEGWEVSSEVGEKSLKLKKDEREIVLKDLKSFDGAYINQDPGDLDFLVNWRKNDNPFVRVSVEEIIAGSIATDLFTDKIVIIGNTASSTADRHYIPYDRWHEKSPQWTYGVEILGQITSSIISAASEGRPLIKVFGGGIGYWLLAIACLGITAIAIPNRDLTFKNLYSLTILSGLALTFLLAAASLFFFQFGWWIPIVPAILGTWLTIPLINTNIQIEKERENVLQITLLAKDFDHKLGNDSHFIALSLNKIEESLLALKTSATSQNEQLCWTTDWENNVNLIRQESEYISGLIDKITRYRERTLELADALSLPQPKIEYTAVNELVSKIVKKIHEHQSSTSFPVIIQEYYDPQFTSDQINRSTIEIVLSNLLENAFEAVSDRRQALGSNYIPLIVISTKKKNNFIEIAVEDNGVGIPRQHQQKIFDWFVSYKSRRGRGLGLAIVKKQLALERGKITVESQVDKGSKFTFSIPRRR